jgi:hypothetical protein
VINDGTKLESPLRQDPVAVGKTGQNLVRDLAPQGAFDLHDQLNFQLSVPGRARK